MQTRYKVEEIAGNRWAIIDTETDAIVGKWQRTQEEAENRLAEFLARKES